MWKKHCYWIQCDYDFYLHYKNGYILHQFLSKQITCQQPFNTLQKLDSSFKKLTSLPPELGQCAALQTLDLSHNKLMCIPSELKYKIR